MKVWLAWAPSSWKSTVVDELSMDWNTVFTEPATQIIKLRISSGETLEWILWNWELFQQQIHDKKILQLREAGSKNISFFDTTIVEDIAHRQVSWIEIKSIQDMINKIRYDKIFYMKHPGVVENNWIRVENYDEVQELDHLKRLAFRDNWYSIIEVPTFIEEWEALTQKNIQRAVTQRVNFIQSKLF